MKKRIYRRSLALGLVLFLLAAMSSVSYATETDDELTKTDGNSFEVALEEDKELISVSEEIEEKVEDEIEHEPEDKAIVAGIDGITDEISVKTDASNVLYDDENINNEVGNTEENLVDYGSENEAEDEDTVFDNIIPDNAYILTNGDVIYGTIVEADEFRWYAFELRSKSKYSIWLQMENSLDADLYIYKYNSATGQISLIGGSATDGAGHEEFDTDVLTEGLYFVAVSGYASAGDFAFAYTESTADAEQEMNDTADAASVVSFNLDYVGVIDNPYDYDYYTFTINEPTIIRYNIDSGSDYKLSYADSTGDAPVVIDGTLIKMNAGTYTFVVYSPSYAYSTSNTYTVRFNKIGEFADENIVPFRAINENAGVVFQTNLTGTTCYVNGHLIDISYKYDYTNYSDPRNGQNYHISLTNVPGVKCQIWPEEAEGPSVVYYYSSTKPAKKVASKPVLCLMYKRTDSNVHFYSIQCVGTGAYAGDTMWEDLGYVIVLIDPDDGKLIDIMELNYFYHFASGSNSINFSNYYGGKMIFNYSLFDYKN